MNALFLLKSKATVSVCYDDNTVRRGMQTLRDSGFTAIPVITRDGDYAGSVSEGDFLWYLYDHPDAKPESVRLSSLLRRGWNPAVTVDVSMEDLMQRAANQNFVPVVDDRNKFIGIITRRDILAYYYEREHTEEDTGGAPVLCVVPDGRMRQA